MNILIVGNVLKDVYLNLDTRTENFETDKHGTKWLDLSFNASEHFFYNRSSSLGGATVSLEVFKKMGLSSSISGHAFSFSDDAIQLNDPAETYRYILIADEEVSYLAPSKFTVTNFDPPAESVDYLFIDRSAKITEKTAAKISAYLDISPNTKLVLYARSPINIVLSSLLSRAELIFLEQSTSVSEESYAPKLANIDPQKIVKLSETQLSCADITEKISLSRIDIMTHLSIYSIAAATILGSFILGESVENSLRMAHINIENSRINSVLSLNELHEISSTAKPTNNLELITANLLLNDQPITTIENLDNLTTLKNSSNGIALPQSLITSLTSTGQSAIDYLTSHRIIPGIIIDQDFEKTKNYMEQLKTYFILGVRFAKWQINFSDTSPQALQEKCQQAALLAEACQTTGLVPVITPIANKSQSAKALQALQAALKNQGIKENTTIIDLPR
ncbi:fructose-bisphosphate aldolase [Candidatus Saccharibacteria bacterium]|nr:fructose-bisphosphate aldolase [Candidatus Saccharibacteria bacterium]